MTSHGISLEAARRIAVRAQLLDGAAGLPGGKEGAAQVIERLGYVQIDTIAVVERAHHHTLRSRLPAYKPEMLHELHAQDRRVFEYWGHRASYLPMADYRYYRPLMKSFYDTKSQRGKEVLRKHGPLMRTALRRIRQEGPLSSKDFAPPAEFERGGWWDWKPAKLALEMLFWRGELMISERRNFQRLYDLTERVLPGEVDTRIPSDDELGRFLVRRALGAYGVAREREIQEHIYAANKKVISGALRELLDAGEVVDVSVAGLESAGYYALPDTLDGAGQGQDGSAQLSLLSPFDNHVIQRERVERLFGFDYRLECFTPAAKRKYGYFVLPILWGERFVGRLDPKADRGRKTLSIQNLLFEPEFMQFGELLPVLANGLVTLARANGCDALEFVAVSPRKVRRELERLVVVSMGQSG